MEACRIRVGSALGPRRVRARGVRWGASGERMARAWIRAQRVAASGSCALRVACVRRGGADCEGVRLVSSRASLGRTLRRAFLVQRAGSSAASAGPCPAGRPGLCRSWFGRGALALGRIGAARCPDSGLHPGRAWPAFGPAPERAGKPRLTPRPLLSSPCANSARKWTRNRALARKRLEIGLCPLGRFARPGVSPVDTPSHDEFRARARFRVHFGREILHVAQTASAEAAYAARPDPRLCITSAAARHAIAKTPKAAKPGAFVPNADIDALSTSGGRTRRARPSWTRCR